MRRRNRLMFRFAAVVLTGSLAAAPHAAVARERGDHCVNPAGVDLNEMFGTSDAIVSPFCTQVAVGERWRASLRVNIAGDDRVFPAGYAPSRSNLDRDFLAKFVSMRYVIDGGTKRERTLEFAASRMIVRSGALPDGTLFVNWLSPRFHPLPAGNHTVDQYITMSDDYWDGLGVDPSLNLLPEGESFAAAFTVRVAKPRR